MIEDWLGLFYVVMWAGAALDVYDELRTAEDKVPEPVRMSRVMTAVGAFAVSAFWPAVVARRFFEWLRGAR